MKRWLIISIRLYVNEIDNRIMFKMELLMLETMKLLRATKNKITRDENSENVPHLETTEVD